MAIPVNWTASAREQLKASMYAGKAGASDNGPKPWTKVTEVEAAIARAFHFGDQLRGSWGLSEGCGTRTPEPPLTKW